MSQTKCEAIFVCTSWHSKSNGCPGYESKEETGMCKFFQHSICTNPLERLKAINAECDLITQQHVQNAQGCKYCGNTWCEKVEVKNENKKEESIL